MALPDPLVPGPQNQRNFEALDGRVSSLISASYAQTLAPPSGDTTGATDTARFVSALAALEDNGGTLKLAYAPRNPFTEEGDPYYISDLIIVPQLVNLVGAGRWATTIRCATADAGIRFGGALGDASTYHGKSGGFLLDGNEIGQAGLILNTVNSEFEDIWVVTVEGTTTNAGNGIYVLGQNNSFVSVIPGNNENSGFVLDNGAGHNSFDGGCSPFWNGRYNIEFRRSAASTATGYDYPQFNHFDHIIAERPGSSTFGSATAGLGSVGHSAGAFNYFTQCELHNFENVSGPAVKMIPDPNAYNCGRLYFEDCTFAADPSNTEAAIHVDAVSGGAAGAFVGDYVVVLKGDNLFVDWATAIKWGTSTPIRDLSQHVLYGTPTYFTADGTGAAKIWTPVTFQNSWANAGGSNTDVQYRMNQIGEVEIRGYAYRASGSTGLPIFTLPAGYRPVATSLTFASFGGVTPVLVEIGSDGTVACAVGSDAASLQITFDPT